jgi:hypothetical protein
MKNGRVEQYFREFPGKWEKHEICNLRYGFECDSGWKQIIREFCADVTELVSWQKKLGFEAEVKSFIVKEKLGILAWQGHCTFTNKSAESLFYARRFKMEVDSAHTCEKSGEIGYLRNIGGLLKTLSEEEYQKIIKDK